MHTELFADRAFGLVPMTDRDAVADVALAAGRAAADRLPGRAPVDTAAVEDLLLRLGRLAEDLPEVAELTSTRSWSRRRG